MSEEKNIVATVGGYLWRTSVFIVLLVIALGMLAISVITGATVEDISEDAVTDVLRNVWESPFPIPSGVALLIVVFPASITWFLREHAVNDFRESWSEAKTQAWEYLLGSGERRAGAVLWALLQLDLTLVLPLGGLGGIAGKAGLPLQAEKIIPAEVKVRYVAQPITQRIQFEKARLRPDGGFEARGSNLPGGAAEMLQQTVRELRRGSGCRASVSLYGFASNEEFKGLESDWKNLQLADHRTEAVRRELSGLAEAKKQWLVVEPPKRWAPPIKPADARDLWKRMRQERNCLVQRHLSGEKRNPDADRVVVLKWKLDGPCEVPAAAEETEPKENG